MQVQSTNPQSILATNYSTPASGTSSSSGSSGSGSTSNSALDLAGTPTESMFLQLLVAQLQYQDPTSPQDPSQFVGELAQFSQLEQTLGIRQDTDTIVKDLTPASTTTPSPTQSTNATTAS